LSVRTWVEVSRRQIAENYRNIRAAVGPGVLVAGVVKANAYGHGAVEVSRILAAEGAKWLAVSNVNEGVELRDAGLGARILVMGGVLPYEREAMIGARLTPVVHSLEELRELDALRQYFPVHLKADTGMARLGTREGAAEIADAVHALRHLQLEGLMSHFASPNNFATRQSEEQIARFESLRAAGILAGIEHFASSNAIAYGLKNSWLTMVRPGIALYGYVSPSSGAAPPLSLDVKPALTWKARIVALKDLAEGAEVGYGALFRAPRPMRTAVIAAGYADGVQHRLSNRGHAIAGGMLVPIVGAVSMDLTTIDVTDCDVRAGDAVTLIGPGLDAEQVAQTAGIISYAVLCGIGNRVVRTYV
jgi:alanine racemase